MSDNDMEEIHLPDDSGKTLLVKRYKGRLWPPVSSEAIRGVETFKSRDDDVFVVAYPKSGSHWIWEVVNLLLAGPQGVPANTKETSMIELSDPEMLEALASPRNLNTHAHFELMPLSVINNRKCKLVYVTRDPRDVAVSYFHHHRHFGYDKGEWKSYLPRFLGGKVDYESWFTYTRGWEQGIQDNPELQVHVTSYEAHKENPREAIEELAAFLGTSIDKDFLAEVVRKTSFNTMKAEKTKSTPSEFQTQQGTHVMFRKGKVGDWKNNFTVTQSEQFDAIFEKEMKGTKAYELYSNIKESD